MSIPEAIKGAQAELARVHSPLQRVQRIAIYARIFAAELFGTVLAVPFGLRAFNLHRSLPDARTAGARAGTVSILRDVRYGPRPRNNMDIYLPPNIELRGEPSQLLAQDPLQQRQQQQGQQGQTPGAVAAGAAGGPSSEAGSGGAPMVLFCHGGVWASGSKWHYAPLAARLAQAGVVTAVMQYSLYPEALVPQMVAEVSQALTWTMDNAAQLGGSPQQVSLVGHSAGAHMCTMALLHRALAASKAAEDSRPRGGGGGAAATGPAAAAGEGAAQAQRAGGGNGSTITQQAQAQPAATPGAVRPAAAGPAGLVAGKAAGMSAEEAEVAAYADQRMPQRLVAIAGVFDIAKHYEYEEARHVHKLSTMERAIGGNHLFPAFSPAVILANALRRQQLVKALHSSWDELAGDPQELLREAGVTESGAHGGVGWAGASRQDGSRAGGAGTSSATAEGAVGPACTLVRPEAAAAEQQQREAQAAGATCGKETAAGTGEGGAVEAGEAPPAVAAARYYQSFDLAGEAIARRIGFDRVAAAEAAAADAMATAYATGQPPPDQPAARDRRGGASAAARAVPVEVPAAVAAMTAGSGPRGDDNSGSDSGRAGSDRAWRIFGLTVEAARRLPPTVLTSSCTDITVPWYESAEMYWMLHDCGVPAKHLVYNKVSHGDFVTQWAALPRISGQRAEGEGDLPPHAADLTKIVSGRARVRYSSAAA